MAKTIYKKKKKKKISIKLRLSVTCILYRRKLPELSGTKCICYTYQIPSKCINSAKTEPLKFHTLLLKVTFSRPFQLMKINCTESYVFFLARTYRARIQQFYKYERHSIFSVRKSLCLALQGSKFDPRDEIQVH